MGKIIIKKLANSEVEMEIEVPAGEFGLFIEQAVINLGRDLEMKGFRKGKVPKEIIEKEVGPDKILIEAADFAVKENYKKAVFENKIEVISQPEIEIKKLTKGNEFIFSAKTAVLPEIKLPDYKKIASNVRRKEIKIEDKEIEDALKWLQRSRAKFTLKNQSAQRGDFVEIEYWISENRETINPVRNQGFLNGVKDAFILGQGYFLPGFEEEIIGMKAGQEKREIVLKKEGKDIKVGVKVKSVQNVEFPEISDQFAKNLGNFENLAALKKNIKEGLNLEKTKAESFRWRNEVLEKISEATKCEIPQVLIEQGKKQMLENFQNWVKENLKISFEDYLVKIRKTEKETLDSFLDQAQKRVKNLLILREIGKRELDPVRDSNSREKAMGEQISNGVDSEETKRYTEEEKIEKIFQLLENI